MPEGMDENAQKIIEICRQNNVRDVKLAKDEAERAVLWAGRKGAFGAVGQVRPSYACCDGTVPRTKLPEVLKKVIELGKEYDRDKDEFRRVKKVSSEILRICAEAGGTISGEHGVGLEKLSETCLIFSNSDLDFEREINTAFDPDDIINPGKMTPAEPCGN